MTQYKHKQVENGFRTSNGARFLQVCQATLGNDWENWGDHPNLDDALSYAHYHIYKRTDEYKSKKGLHHRLCFLWQGLKQPKSTKQKMSTYSDVAEDALAIGLVDYQTYYDLKG